MSWNISTASVKKAEAADALDKAATRARLQRSASTWLAQPKK